MRVPPIRRWPATGIPSHALPHVESLGSQPWDPASNVEQSQGNPYPGAHEITPNAYNVGQGGFVNPFALTFFVHQLQVSLPERVVPPNFKRCYLLLQNQGPGNIYLNFGQDVVPPTVINNVTVANSNGMQLISKQVYEQIGGGDVDSRGVTRTYAFVSPDYISVTTDLAGTTLLIGEGVWRPHNRR